MIYCFCAVNRNYGLAELSKSLLCDEDSAVLDDLYERLCHKRETFAGYPCNQVWDYSELARFQEFVINNVGDPFADSNYQLNTHAIEREVVNTFAKLTEAPEGEFWGYVTSGGTEGNMYGLYLARELLQDCIVYFCEDAHYSVPKMLRVLNLRSIMIKSQMNGEMDYEDLYESLKIHRDVKPIIFANVGTTMKGGVDNLDKILGMIKDLRFQNHYIHVDAALSGMILPFVEDAQPWNFAAGADSISISGHKMIGSPLPCGIVVAKKKNVDRIARSIEYVGVLDTTISGSRNAMTPLFLWYSLRKHGVEGYQRLVHGCLEMAMYAVNQFAAEGIRAWVNKNSVTVVFPKPSAEVVGKWQLAPCDGIAHLITMPHVTREMVDEIVMDVVGSLSVRVS